MNTLSCRLVELLNFRACCCLLCLTVARQTFGDFVGVEADIRIDLTICQDTSQDFIDEPLTVCSLYAVFDDPTDRLLSVINEGMSTTDPNWFFQHPSGADTPYDCFLQEVVFPDLLCDSYVTIGNECNSGGTDGSTVDPLNPCPFNPEWPNCIGGWFNANPPNGQGDAGTYPDLRVLVAQFSMAEGDNAFGEVGMYFRSHDIVIMVPHKMFDCQAGACLGSACPADVNSDGTVGAFDLATLLGAWGPCDNGQCRCVDADDDGHVGPADLAALLGVWGACPQ